MKKIYFKALLVLALIGGSTSACDDALDINESPNSPSGSTTAFTLPVAQTTLAYMLNLDLGIMTGFLSQYWTQAYQAAQYQVYDQYNYNGNQTSTAWLHAYAWVLEDLNYVEQKALEDGTPNYAAIARLLSVYTYQVIVDVWDSAPYSEALGGKSGNLNPVYEDGQTIYDGLIADIDEALELINPGAMAITPGADDFLYGGDMAAWVRFANTLKLRIYMRQSEARPSVAEQGIDALYAAGAEFVGLGDDAMVPFPGGSNNENPLYRGEISPNGLGGVNLNGSAAIIQRLVDNNDPRVDFFFDPAETGTFAGAQVGIPQGEGTTQLGSQPQTDNSVPSSTNVIAPNSPVYLMTASESLFLQAEAAERGWGTGDAEQLYNAAVTESFRFTGFAADANSFLNGAYEYPATSAERLETIATQKWYALCGIMNVEAWAELRRADYLDLSPSVAGTGASLNGSTFPQRALYPSSEISTNTNSLPNGNIGDPVWWNK